MNPSSRAEAKSKIGLSFRVFDVLAQEAARQDRGDFGGAFGGGELVGRGEDGGRHVMSGGGDKEPDTIVIAELVLDHPGISGV